MTNAKKPLTDEKKVERERACHEIVDISQEIIWLSVGSLESFVFICAL